MLRSSNPALRDNTFIDAQPYGDSNAMTIQGTVNKTFFLLAVTIIAAGFTWQQYGNGNNGLVTGLMIGGAIGGLILGLITSFKPNIARITAPLYCALEGLFLGGLSAQFNARFDGIVIQAVALTFGTLLALLAAYKSRLIKPTENFKLGVAAATGGIFIFYIITFILGFFMPGLVSTIHSGSPIGIGFSLFVIVIAALNLVMDFDFIEEGEARGAPKHMEWYGAFALMVTLIWLYIEFLRLLSKLQSRD